MILLIYNIGKISEYSAKNATGSAQNRIGIIYNAYQQILELNSYDNSGRITAQTKYEYDANQRATRSDEYYSSASTGGNLILSYYNTYEYNGIDKRPSKYYNFSVAASSSSYTYNFLYDNNDNLITEGSLSASSGQRYITERIFDNKKPALITFAGIDTYTGNNPNTNSVALNTVFGKNNIISETHTGYDANGAQIQRTVKNYTYEYDSKGRPTKQIITSSTGGTVTNTFTYHCH